MTKTEIRKQMKGLNTALSSEQREELSARIFNEAERLPAFARAKVVALFASLKDEPLTAPALERWSRSKRIVLPRVEGDIMRFYDYDPASMNDSGSFGISEPEATALCRPEEIDFIIVPGVAFTAAGMRLGRGKGFYDKYLSQPGFRAFKAGVCYPHQVVEELPADPFDVPVDHLAADGKTSADFGPIIKSYRSHVFSGPKTYPFGIPPSKTGKHRLRQRIVKRENTASKKPASTDAGFLTNIIQYYYR